jgi:NAD(P)-dependent dehydrogenase (short-subunit alcohol dehydrogenase family)
MSDLPLQDCTVLVTGASRGIGQAVAAAFVAAGARVAITGRRLDTLQAAARQIDPSEDRCVPLTCHQGKPDEIAALFRQIDERFGRLDIAVVNAATNPVLGGLLAIDKVAWDKVIEVNLTGAFLTAQAAGQRMQQQQAGRIVFVTSVAGIDPMPLLGAYSVSKAALIGLTKTLAKELAPSGVRVNAVAPGLIETRFSQALIDNQKLHDQFVAGIPLGRHGQPDDVVGAVLFLASDAARYMTGQILVVDGGMRM